MTKQYTKFQDSNGKRLALGDFIEVVFDKKNKIVLEVVKCENGEVAFYHKKHNKIFTHRDILLVHWKSLSKNHKKGARE